MVWSAIAGLVAGVGLSALWSPLEPPAPQREALAPPPDPSPAREAELRALREALEAVRRDRDALTARLAALESPRSEAAPAADAPSRDAEDPAEVQTFDEAWLRERGHMESEIARLRERWDALELERLYLADRARREGWHGSPRFRDQILQLREQLREEVGDDEYDTLLYAAGRENRVVVTDVLDGSAAAAVGIEREDVIRSYAGRPIYEMGDLIRTTGAGQPGRSTEVRVTRNGEELRFFVPRGPLGVRVRRDRRAPDTLR